jgi:uncharacterized membrane protein
MRILKTVLKYLFAVFFIMAGLNHFRDEAFYMKIMPDYIPLSLHRPSVIVSGIAEVVLGVMLLMPRTSRLAAWGLIALLIAVFPANIYVYQHQDIFPGVSPTLHLIRLPLQAVMILWAWWYTLPDGPHVGYAPTTEI